MGYDPVEERKQALRFARIEGKNMLDVGTGKGMLAIMAAKDFGCKVTTIEMDEEKVGIAKDCARAENVEDRIRFIVGDARDMPFPDDSFDIAVAFNALHHCRNGFRKIVDEMFRVSKTIAISELNENGVKLFDESAHPDQNHKDMAIDLEELQAILDRHSTVRVLEREIMITFVCTRAGGGRKR